MFALGQDFFAAGMLDRAESVFQELLDSNSKSISKAAICESLRTIYEQTQEWQKAIETTKCTKKSSQKSEENSTHNINIDSLISHYYCELADEALLKGNIHEVDGLIVKASKAYKQSTRLMSLQGDVSLHQKKYKNSLEYYLKAVKQDSRLLSMLFNKLEDTANKSGLINYLQEELLNLYLLDHDNNVFEAIIKLANKHGSNTQIKSLISDTLLTKKLSIKSIYTASDFMNKGGDKGVPIQQNSASNQVEKNNLTHLNQSLENHLQGVPSFLCGHCGYKMHDYLWRCPACNHWDTVDQA